LWWDDSPPLFLYRLLYRSKGESLPIQILIEKGLLFVLYSLKGARGNSMLRVVERKSPESGRTPGSKAAVDHAQSQVTALYHERGAEFLAYAMRLSRDEDLARDALQEGFLRYFIACSADERIESPRAWMYRVMHNYLIDRMKQVEAHKECELPQSLAYTSALEDRCFEQQVLARLESALSRREWECFRLRTEGMRYEEIAARTNLASGTVGALINRALRKIRRLVDPEAMKLRPMEQK